MAVLIIFLTSDTRPEHRFERAYPLLDAFIQKKVVYDPKGVFYNTSFDITGRGK